MEDVKQMTDHGISQSWNEVNKSAVFNTIPSCSRCASLSLPSMSTPGEEVTADVRISVYFEFMLQAFSCGENEHVNFLLCLFSED